MQPDVLSILIGINDTWRRYDSNLPMTVEEYEANYRRLVQDVKENTKAKLLLLEPFLLHADPAKECFREDLDPKILAARPGGAGLCRHVPAAGRPAGRRVGDRGAVPLVGGRGAPERGGIAADWPVLCRGLRRHAGKINKTRAAQPAGCAAFGLERGK